MMAILAKPWFRREQKQYKAATDEYFFKSKEVLDRYMLKRILDLKARSIVVVIDQAIEIPGLKIPRALMPDAKPDEQLILKRVDKNLQVATGFISRVSEDLVQLKLDEPLKMNPKDLYKKISIEYNYEHILEERKQLDFALYKFKWRFASTPIQKCILGGFKDISNVKFDKVRLIMPHGFQLVDRQSAAVKQSMIKRISIIEGVPGSGKTLVGANLAYSICRLKERKVLFCSPIEATVDKVVDLLSTNTSISLVKLSDDRKKKYEKRSYTDQTLADSETEHSLNNIVKNLVYQKNHKRYEQSLRKWQRVRRSSIKAQAERMTSNCSDWLKSKVENDTLSKADVICCNLKLAGDRRLSKGLKIDMLIIDDADAASELDCIVAMMAKGIKQVTLISDIRKHIRLSKSEPIDDRPKIQSDISDMIQSKELTELGGLVDRWLSMGLGSFELKTQFRMIKFLSEFPNDQFYFNRLRTDVRMNEKLNKRLNSLLEKGFSWLPRRGCPTALYNTWNINLTVLEIIKRIVDESVSASNIIVLNNEKVKDEYSESLSTTGAEICTIQDFYGQEKEFVILACHEQLNQDQKEQKDLDMMNYNFLTSDTALNVSLTRARLGLFVVADLRNINSEQEDSCISWKKLVTYYEKEKLVVCDQLIV